MRPALRFGFLLFLILLVTSLAFPWIFGGAYPHAPGPQFDKAASELYLHEIEQQRPRIVLLGDSMLTKGVSREIFEQQIGARTYKLDIPGSASALWYVVLKSNILPARPRPRMVVVLFRDTLLTAPTFRTTGPYFGLIDKFAGPHDTLLLERAYLPQLTPLQTAMEAYLPIYTYRGELRESIDAGLRHWLPGAFGCDRDCADKSAAGVLADIQLGLSSQAILQAEQVIYTPEQLDFNAQVGRSFLPEMIRLAREAGTRLVFVRAPTNIFPSAAAQPAGLGQYMADLDRYLESQDSQLLDLSQVDGITPAQFSDPHHMTLEGKAIFTRALAEALKNHGE